MPGAGCMTYSHRHLVYGLLYDFPSSRPLFPLIVTCLLKQPLNSLEGMGTMRGNRGLDEGKSHRDLCFPSSCPSPPGC